MPAHTSAEPLDSIQTSLLLPLTLTPQRRWLGQGSKRHRFPCPQDSPPSLLECAPQVPTTRAHQGAKASSGDSCSPLPLQADHAKARPLIRLPGHTGTLHSLPDGPGPLELQLWSQAAA